MISSVYSGVVLIDTSAAIALHNPTERLHAETRQCFSMQSGVIWAAVDVTAHECFTRVRYAGAFLSAMEHFKFFRESNFRLLRFAHDDEIAAQDILRRYSDHRISFHDALCAAVMIRAGIYRILTLDKDFAILGFEMLPQSFT